MSPFRITIVAAVFLCTSCGAKTQNVASNMQSPPPERTPNIHSGSITKATEPSITVTGNRVAIRDQNSGFSFDYDADDLLPVDYSVELPNQLAICIINTAIQGIFRSGIYDIQAKSAITSPLASDILSNMHIARPIKISMLNDGYDNFYLIPVVYRNKIVASARVSEDRMGMLRYAGITIATCPIDEIPRSADFEIGGIRRTVAARQLVMHGLKYSAQALDAMDRVHVRSNVSSGYLKYMWRIKGEARSQTFVSTTGEVYRMVNRTTQGTSGKFGRDAIVLLERI